MPLSKTVVQPNWENYASFYEARLCSGEKQTEAGDVIEETTTQMC